MSNLMYLYFLDSEYTLFLRTISIIEPIKQNYYPKLKLSPAKNGNQHRKSIIERY